MSMVDMSRGSEIMQTDGSMGTETDNILSVLSAVSDTTTHSGYDAVQHSGVSSFSDFPIPADPTILHNEQDNFNSLGSFNAGGLPAAPMLSTSASTVRPTLTDAEHGWHMLKATTGSTLKAPTTAYSVATTHPADLTKKDLNLCTAPEMRRHSGMSARLCSTVINEKKSGKFTSWGNLQDRISGLGPKKLQLLQQRFVITLGHPTLMPHQEPAPETSKRRKTSVAHTSNGRSGAMEPAMFDAQNLGMPRMHIPKPVGTLGLPYTPTSWAAASTGSSTSLTVLPQPAFTAGMHAPGDISGASLYPAAVVGLGAAAMDTLAFVDAYPERDAKIRTSGITRVGGGNCANTMMQLAKLGNATAIVTKVGRDRDGLDIVNGLAKYNVNTNLIKYVDGNSPSTYVIVDKQTQTRTCIHSPAASGLDAVDVSPAMLEGALVLHLDSRHTLAAIRAATLARDKGVLVSVEVEKDRPNLAELLKLADYVFTNERFPSLYCAPHIPGYEHIKESAGVQQACAQKLMEFCPNAKFICTTLGDRGSVLLTRQQWVDNVAANSGIPQPKCPFISVRKSTVAVPTAFEDESHANPAGAAAGVQEWAWLECDAYAPPAGTVVDSTGCGDVYVGAFLHGLVRTWPLDRCMILATYCASHKLSFHGGQSGPTLLDIKTSFPGLVQDPGVEKYTGLLAFSTST